MKSLNLFFFSVIVVLFGANGCYSMESIYDRVKDEYTTEEVKTILERAKKVSKEIENMILDELTVLQEEEMPHDA